ncbi:hypothetical protein KEJ39_09375 [Candidatus Bathyarchaeota archaeon]|nr:hypothetical protein [Candidatus Bathyarchaeota archaeon]
MDEKAVAGIALIVIGLFGFVFFFPIYSPMVYGGWGCPMMGRWEFGGPRSRILPHYGGLYGYPAMIFLFDALFLAILFLGVYLVWKSTRTT